MDFIAWDIETCPQNLDQFTPAQKNRYKLELSYKLKNSLVERTEEEASRLVRSVHPFLGWVCCISLVHGYEGGMNKAPVSFTASTPGEEEALLRGFWERVKEYRSRSVVWVTFNGKRFDVPFVVARSYVTASSRAEAISPISTRSKTNPTRTSRGSGRCTTGWRSSASTWASRCQKTAWTVARWLEQLLRVVSTT